MNVRQVAAEDARLVLLAQREIGQAAPLAIVGVVVGILLQAVKAERAGQQLLELVGDSPIAPQRVRLQLQILLLERLKPIRREQRVGVLQAQEGSELVRVSWKVTALFLDSCDRIQAASLVRPELDGVVKRKVVPRRVETCSRAA